MADGVDATVKAMPAASARSMLDRTRRQPEHNQLPMRDDSMLPLGELGNGSIESDRERTWAHLGRYVRPN